MRLDLPKEMGRVMRLPECNVDCANASARDVSRQRNARGDDRVANRAARRALISHGRMFRDDPESAHHSPSDRRHQGFAGGLCCCGAARGSRPSAVGHPPARAETQSGQPSEREAYLRVSDSRPGMFAIECFACCAAVAGLMRAGRNRNCVPSVLSRSSCHNVSAVVHRICGL